MKEVPITYRIEGKKRSAEIPGMASRACNTVTLTARSYNCGMKRRYTYAVTDVIENATEFPQLVFAG